MSQADPNPSRLQAAVAFGNHCPTLTSPLLRVSRTHPNALECHGGRGLCGRTDGLREQKAPPGPADPWGLRGSCGRRLSGAIATIPRPPASRSAPGTRRYGAACRGGCGRPTAPFPLPPPLPPGCSESPAEPGGASCTQSRHTGTLHSAPVPRAAPSLPVHPAGGLSRSPFVGPSGTPAFPGPTRFLTWSQGLRVTWAQRLFRGSSLRLGEDRGCSDIYGGAGGFLLPPTVPGAHLQGLWQLLSPAQDTPLPQSTAGPATCFPGQLAARIPGTVGHRGHWHCALGGIV